MTEQELQSDDLSLLLAALCDGDINPEDFARLERRLETDPAARRWYIAYLDMHGELYWDHLRHEGQELSGKADEREMRTDEFLPAATSGATGHSSFILPPSEAPSHESRSPDLESPFPSIVIDASSTLRSPFYSSLGGWLLSYGVATVIMGVAILGFWAYKITHHQHIAEAPSQSAPSEAMPEMVFVGRITGMVDVKWSDDPRYLPPPGFAHVPLGRKYILSSGLLEITYDSGAKVVLEGPCTYEVESTGGGYLALGKLTARVETRGEGRGARGEDVPPSPLSPLPSPLFSVRTPTAVVTDLGTEFGVEVDKAGASKTHVFQGRVEMRLADGGQGEPLTIQLGAGESGQVEHGKDGRGSTLVRGAADPTAFSLVSPGQLASLARQRRLKPLRRWEAFSKELRKRDDLTAYYDFQPDEKDRSMLRNRAATGRGGDGRIEGGKWVSGRFPGKYALRFDWPSHRVRAPTLGGFRQLTLAAWVRLDSLPNDRAGLLMSDGWWKMGQVYWQILHDGKMAFSVVVGPRVDITKVSSRPVVDVDHPGQWDLLAVACDLDAETVAFYCNGDCVGRQAIEVAELAALNPGWVTIANWYDPHAPLTERDLSLQGCLGELMIFRTALSEEEIRRVYRSADPLDTTVGAAVELPPKQQGSATRSEKGGATMNDP